MKPPWPIMLTAAGGSLIGSGAVTAGGDRALFFIPGAFLLGLGGFLYRRPAKPRVQMPSFTDPVGWDSVAGRAHDVTPTLNGLLHHSTCWCRPPGPLNQHELVRFTNDPRPGPVTPYHCPRCCPAANQPATWRDWLGAAFVCAVAIALRWLGAGAGAGR